MQTYKTEIYKGIEIKIQYDEDYESPNDWGNDNVFLVYDHRQFNVRVNGFAPEYIVKAMQNKEKTFDGYYYFPVFAYIHSGISLSLCKNYYPFTCNFDTSFAGFALVKRGKGMYTRDKAYKAAESLISTWNKYLSGEVFGYTSEYGSCWGYYGTDSIPYMIEEAKGEIDQAEKEQIRQHGRKVKTWIKNHVPLTKRESYQFA